MLPCPLTHAQASSEACFLPALAGFKQQMARSKSCGAVVLLHCTQQSTTFEWALRAW